MKKFIPILSLLVLLTSCADKTVYGKCVGLYEEKDSKYDYKVSKLNVVMGAVFFSLIVPPVIVIADELLCPYKLKTTPNK